MRMIERLQEGHVVLDILMQGRLPIQTDLCSVEPQAAEALQDLCLEEPDPTSVELHDDRKRGVGCENDVVNHAGVVAHPDMVCAGHRPGAVIPHNACPAGHKRLALELHQDAFPLGPSLLILQACRCEGKSYLHKTKGRLMQV